jgi:hypothetical protein
MHYGTMPLHRSRSRNLARILHPLGPFRAAADPVCALLPLLLCASLPRRVSFVSEAILVKSRQVQRTATALPTLWSLLSARLQLW